MLDRHDYIADVQLEKVDNDSQRRWRTLVDWAIIQEELRANGKKG